jgi:uncharacterized alpha-E superfamily protein
VLSRIAENVYWIGRYMERADDTARLLSTHLYGLLQAGSPNDRLLPEELLAVLGRDQSSLSSAPINLQTVAWHYIADPDTDSSVLNCLHLARENARRSQQQLAVEAWESLNTAASTLEPLIDQRGSVGELLRVVPQLTQSFLGVVHTALQRDETWTFLQLGMLLERADMTLRVLLLGAKSVAGRDATDPLAVHMRAISLRACAAPDVLRTSGPDQLTDRSVRDVLLREPSVPRSVWFCLDNVSRLTGGEPAAMALALRDEVAVPEDEADGNVDADWPDRYRDLLARSRTLHSAIVATYMRPVRVA